MDKQVAGDAPDPDATIARLFPGAVLMVTVRVCRNQGLRAHDAALRILSAIIYASALVATPSALPFAYSQEAPKTAVPDPLAISREDRLKIFERLWEIVDQRYFDPAFNGVDWAAVKQKYRPQIEAAGNKANLRSVLQKMLDELHASHLSVWYHATISLERVKQDMDQSIPRKNNFFFDPGLNIRLIEGRWVVDSVKQNSGAQLAGVQRGWILTYWNGEPYSARTASDFDLGDTVQIRFIDQQGQERNIPVRCKLYLVPETQPVRTVRALAGGLLYLRFSEFLPGTDGWLAEQLSKNEAAPAVIIDLRGNPGGVTAVMRKSLEPFFGRETAFGEFRDRSGKEPPLRARGRGKNAFGGRVIVLVDEMSTSSSELFAAAIQESGRGSVIGRQSGGSVFAAHYYTLQNGFKAEVPFRDYQTAKGIRLEGHGVIPDRVVKFTLKDFLENHDPDIKVALEMLGSSNR